MTRSVWASTAVLSLLGSTLAVIASASPASAMPQNCSAGKASNSGWSYCEYGSGSHRVRLKCQSPSTGDIFIVYGPWVGTGSYSTKTCTVGSWRAIGASVDVQGD